MSRTSVNRQTSQWEWSQSLGFALIFNALLQQAIVPAKADASSNVLTLGLAVNTALAGNPGLAEIRSRAQALSAVPPQAGALPDPQVNVEMLNVPSNSFDLHKEDMTMLGVGVSQSFPFPGKLALREKIAEHEALAAEQSVEEARLKLISQVKQSWWQIYYYEHALDLQAQAELFYQQLIASVQSQYALGKGGQKQVLMAQLDYSKLKQDKLELISLLHRQTARLNVLLDREPSALITLPKEAAIALPELQENNLQARALQTRPLFAQHHKMLSAAKARLELAQRDFYPDFTVGAGLSMRQNTPTGQPRSDFANIQLSMNVPLYADSKQTKAVEQRQGELVQEKYALEDEHHNIQAQIAEKTAEYQHAKEKLYLLEHELIPQARQTINVLQAGYQTNQSGFTELLQSEVMLLQTQSQYWQTLALTQALLAELSADIGAEIGEGKQHD